MGVQHNLPSVKSGDRELAMRNRIFTGHLLESIYVQLVRTTHQLASIMHSSKDSSMQPSVTLANPDRQNPSRERKLIGCMEPFSATPMLR